MEQEIWKDIIGYEGIYQISSLGRVKSVSRCVNHINGVRHVHSKILKPNSCSLYLNISLSRKCVMNRFTIHRLVAKAFIPNPNNLPQVNHRDGNKFNNKVENLEWCSSSDNQKHAYRIGLKKSPNLGRFGSLNHSSKAIIQYSLTGVPIQEYGSTREASRVTKINQGTIAACARGERVSAGSYKWRYK